MENGVLGSPRPIGDLLLAVELRALSCGNRLRSRRTPGGDDRIIPNVASPNLADLLAGGWAGNFAYGNFKGRAQKSRVTLVCLENG